MKTQTHLTITNILIIVAFLSTLLVSLFPELYVFGLNDIYLSEKNYLYFIIQLCTYGFIHAGVFHFFSNMLFLGYFGNEIERDIGDKKYLLFFVLSNFFIALCVLIFSTGNTVGISGFCMATLAYYTLRLYYLGNPDYRGGLTALLINIGIGFLPGISLIGHFFGVIAGVGFYYLNKKLR